MTASEKKLVRAWAGLMGLSLTLALAAESARPRAYVLGWVILVAAVAWCKARIVLSTYLDLRRAPSALAGFSFAIFIILAIVVSSFALQAFVAHFA